MHPRATTLHLIHAEPIEEYSNATHVLHVFRAIESGCPGLSRAMEAVFKGLGSHVNGHQGIGVRRVGGCHAYNLAASKCACMRVFFLQARNIS